MGKSRQHNLLVGDRGRFFEAHGCEARSAESFDTERTCSEGKLACAVSKEPLDSKFMCCGYEYQSRAGPAITTMLGQNLHIWKTGLATLLQIPLKVRDQEVPELLVQGNILPYTPYWETLGCEDGRITEVTISGSSVGAETVTVRSGSLETSQPFAVRLGEGPWQELSWNTTVMDRETLLVSSPTVSLTGVISQHDPDHWGPDAEIQAKVGNLSITVLQHTTGRESSSKAMLDVSVAGKYPKYSGVGGWLGSDGANLAEGVLPVPCITMKTPPS